SNEVDQLIAEALLGHAQIFQEAGALGKPSGYPTAHGVRGSGEQRLRRETCDTSSDRTSHARSRRATSLPLCGFRCVPEQCYGEVSSFMLSFTAFTEDMPAA